MSMLAVIAGTLLALGVVPPFGFDRQRISEAASTPVIVGFVVSRVVFLLFDNPGSLTRIRDILVFRSGLEFWAGVLFAVGFCCWQNRRAPERLTVLLAAGVPYALVGLAFYEGACLLRDGCLGPTSSVGLTPYGLTRPMIPVGLFVAAAFLVSAWLLRRNHTMNAVTKLSASLAVLGGVRALASRYLPAFGSSRVGLESFVAFFIGVSASAVSLQKSRKERAARPAVDRSDDPAVVTDANMNQVASFQKRFK